jgi:transposase
MKYLFVKVKSTKKMYDDMSVRLCDKCPSYSTAKNWVARFRTGCLGNADEDRSGRPTQVTIPGNVDAIHSMFLEARRISTKKIEGPLRYVCQKRVGYLCMTF